MVSRENAVILLFMAIGLSLTYGGRALTSASDTVLIGVLLFVSVLVPQSFNNYLDARERE